jgi:CHAT domain-containing protein/tetratricopeptide (TPR) repeat protein
VAWRISIRQEVTTGLPSPAEPYTWRALTLSQEQLGEQHPQTATSLDRLALLYRNMGDYVQAETCYQQALQLRKKYLGERHSDVGISLNNLGVFYYERDDMAAAERLTVEGLEIARVHGGEDHPDVASALGNLARIHYEQGRYAQARPLFERSLAILRGVLGDEHPHVALIMSGLALVYHAMGETDRAEKLLRQALHIREQALGERDPACARDLHTLAWLCAATGRLQEALSLKARAIVIEDRLMGQVFSLASEKQRQQYLALLTRFVDSFLTLIFIAPSPSQQIVRQALELILHRKSIGMQALAVQQEAVLSGRYPQLAPRLQELTALRLRIAGAVLQVLLREEGEFTQQLDIWQHEREQLESELAHIPEMQVEQAQCDVPALCEALPENSALIEFVRYEEFDFQALPHQRHLPWKPAHYAAFILHAKEPEMIEHVDLGEAIPLADQVNEFRRMLLEGEREAAPEAAPIIEPRTMQLDTSRLSQLPPTQPGRHTGSDLRRRLFDPLLSALRGKTRLFIAPAGILHWLPFEVLPTATGSYLIDTYLISYLTTGRDLLLSRAPHAFVPAAGVACVIADPDFDMHSTSGTALHPPKGLRLSPFARLKGTRKEGELIAGMLGVTPILGEQAVESVLKALHSPSILHIATHGFSLTSRENWGELPGAAEQRETFASTGVGVHLENPLFRSGLVFAGVNTWCRGEPLPPEAEDGIFTAEDVAALDLRGTELVVLSACQTGLGREVHSGEGMPALRRAFMLAGAKTLVSSLWKVDDQQTQELMEKFYQYILRGQPRHEALWSARLDMKALYHHPYYWGAFICQGSPGPLQNLVA